MLLTDNSFNKYKTRNYKFIKKDTYCGGNKYIVKSGDTLFYISWITGVNFYDLFFLNYINDFYSLFIGQILNLYNCTSNIEIINNDIIFSSSNSFYYNIFKLFVSYYNKKFVFDFWYFPIKDDFVNFLLINNILEVDVLCNIKNKDIFSIYGGKVVYAGVNFQDYYENNINMNNNIVIIDHNNSCFALYYCNGVVLVSEREVINGCQKLVNVESILNMNNSVLNCSIYIYYKGKIIDLLFF